MPLPSVRALAADEVANPLTVAKAYQGLQTEGLVIVRRGVGLFVAPGARARLRTSEREPLRQRGMAGDPRAHGPPRASDPAEADRARNRLAFRRSTANAVARLAMADVETLNP